MRHDAEVSTTRTAPRTVEGTSEVVDGRAARLAPVLSGAWAVAQGVALSLAVVILLAVVALLEAPDAGATEVPWTAAARVAGGLWLLGHGVPVPAGGVTLHVVPLGIGALALFTTYVSAKRSAIASLTAVVSGAATYLVIVLAMAAAAHVGWVGLAFAAVGALVVGGGGMAAGTLAQPEAPRLAEVTEGYLGWISPVLRLGVRAGFLALALVIGLSALVVVVWLFAGRNTSHDVLAMLAPGWLGGAVLGIAQLALLPNLVVWALAWLAGPGFAIGADTSFSAQAVVDGPMPALPLLGALPSEDWTGVPYTAAPVLVVLAGAVAGWFAWRRLEPSLVRWPDVGLVLLGLAGTSGLGAAVLQLWAGGSAGAGRLTEVGADPWVTGGLVAAATLVGSAVVLLLAHTRPWQYAASPARADDTDGPGQHI